MDGGGGLKQVAAPLKMKIASPHQPTSFSILPSSSSLDVFTCSFRFAMAKIYIVHVVFNLVFNVVFVVQMWKKCRMICQLPV